MSERSDMFVRAVHDGFIQIGIADPDLPYAERPVEIKLIDRRTAALLIAALAAALEKEEG